MTSPISRLAMGSCKKKKVVQQEPSTGNTSSRLSMRLDRQQAEDAGNTNNRTPTPPPCLGSVWIAQTSLPTRSKQAISTKGDGVHTPSGLVTPKVTGQIKVDTVQTPSRRITRSITILSDSKEGIDGHSDIDGSNYIADNDTQRHHIKKCSKREIETIHIESSSKKKKMSIIHKPQESGYYIPQENRFGGSLNVFFRKKVISKLNNKMTATQKDLFRRTCFGHFLQLNELRLQHQVIHNLLLMEVRQSTHDEMWFKIAGKHIRFSIEEFALVTGLKCHGDDNTNMYNVGHSRIKHLFFGHQKRVYRKDIENTFNSLTAATDDEDVVKLGILYLISSFLYTSTSGFVVADEIMTLVDSPHMETFPWGKELFRITYKYLKLALAKSNPKIDDPKGILSYRLHGFPLAFQIWIYESIPYLSGKVCTRVSRTFPRIINWSNKDERVLSANIDKILFSVTEGEVVVLIPTEDEKVTPYFRGLMERERVTIPSSIPAGADLRNDPGIQAKNHNYASSSNPSFMPCYNDIANDNPRNREPPVIEVLEHLMNQMVDIKESQAQIIGSQNEIKANVTRLEKSVDSRFETILQMFVRAKKHAAKGQQATEANVTPSNEAVTPNIEYITNQRKKVTQICVGLHSNVVMESTPVDTNIKKFVSNPSPMKRATNGNDTAPNEVIDDINYTEEDLIQVDEIIKSASLMKSKHAPQVTEKMVRTYVDSDVGEKATEHVAYPVGNQSGSYMMTSKQSCQIAAPGNTDDNHFTLYAFKDDMVIPDEEDVHVFEEWFAEGYKPRYTKYKFQPSKDIINPPFQFGPYIVETKTWWHELSRHNIFLRDSHINTCFYYFRKMIKFSDVISYNGTTTDSFFGSILRAAYKPVKDDIHAICKFRSLIQYASGDSLHCNTNWSNVEHVLIPILMETKGHWILADFDIKDKSLYIYNSSRVTVRDRMVIADVEAFAYVLPCLMVKINAWKPTVVNSVETIEPLSVKLVTNIPQDDTGHNCGLFVIKYADYIIHHNIIGMADNFDAISSRLHIAAQLFKHGCEKQIEDYETDFDLVPCSVRRDRKLKGMVIA